MERYCAVYYNCRQGDIFCRQTPFTPCFHSPFLFYPLFSFCNGKRPASSHRGSGRFPFYLRPALRKGNKSFTAYSKSVHILKDIFGYTDFVIKGSRNPASGRLSDLFLFYSLFSNLYSKPAKRRRPVLLNGRRRFALVLPYRVLICRFGLHVAF